MPRSSIKSTQRRRLLRDTPCLKGAIGAGEQLDHVLPLRSGHLGEAKALPTANRDLHPLQHALLRGRPRRGDGAALASQPRRR